MEIPLDGWCVQVFHLGADVDVVALTAAVMARVPGATCSDGDTDAGWLTIETLDEPALVASVHDTVRSFDAAAVAQVVSRPTVAGLLAG
ncbi:hypothetical protein ASD11_16135 [Aeromicrobium sp. Root495]|nr:hypothetical protein ASD11_16135 [Aeromicrobium sp. Root495]